MTKPRYEPWFQMPYAISRNAQLRSVPAKARWYYMEAVIECLLARNDGEIPDRHLRSLMDEEPNRKRYIDALHRAGLITYSGVPGVWKVADLGGWSHTWMSTQQQLNTGSTSTQRRLNTGSTSTQQRLNAGSTSTQRRLNSADDGTAGQGAPEDYKGDPSRGAQKDRERETTSRPASPDGRDVVARAAPLRADGAARPAPEREKDQERAVAGHPDGDCAGLDEFDSMSKADALASIRNSIAKAKENSPHVRDRDTKLSRWNGSGMPDLLGKILGGEK